VSGYEPRLLQLVIKRKKAFQVSATTRRMTTPTAPFIGGLTASNKPWTGGEPNPSWTGSKNTQPSSPYCIRDPEDMKLYKYRTAMSDKKVVLFRRDDKKLTLRYFSDEVQRHLETTGMDSVFYVPDPLEPTVMLNLITHHSRFTIDMVSEFVSKLTSETDLGKPMYDDYDFDNLKVSRIYLENVLETGLLNDLRATAPRSMSGPEFWMCFVAEVQSDSLERLRQIESDIKTKMIPANYPGEDIGKMSLAIVEACHELDVGDMLPSDIILQIVNNFTKCSVETFKHPFLNRRLDVVKFLKRIRGKDKTVIAAIPVADRITYRTLCKEATEEYKELLDTKMWGPSANAGDSGDAPQALLAEVRKLVKNYSNDKPAKDKKDVICHYCKETGHYKSACPKLQAKNSNQAPKTTPAPNTQPSGGSSSTSTDPNSKKTAWFRVRPEPNSPQTMKRGEKTWHWCDTCAKWCISHGTSGHVDKEDKSPAPSSQANTASINSPSPTPPVGLAACGW